MYLLIVETFVKQTKKLLRTLSINYIRKHHVFEQS